MKTSNTAYRAAGGVAFAAAFILVWMIPAVGVLGVEIVTLNGFFVALFVGSAWLFRHAAREQPPAGGSPAG